MPLTLKPHSFQRLPQRLWPPSPFNLCCFHTPEWLGYHSDLRHLHNNQHASPIMTTITHYRQKNVSTWFAHSDMAEGANGPLEVKKILKSGEKKSIVFNIKTLFSTKRVKKASPIDQRKITNSTLAGTALVELVYNSSLILIWKYYVKLRNNPFIMSVKLALMCYRSICNFRFFKRSTRVYCPL